MRLDLGEWQIRSWRGEDELALLRYGNNRKIWLNLRDAFPHPFTAAAAKAWVLHASRRSPELSFALASKHQAIGGIGLALQNDVHKRSAEIGYWLGEPFWGRGIATQAVKAFIKYAFARFDLVRLYEGVFEWNPPPLTSDF
jgi:ribosomal-protein-alanine N-acetyltransferase